MKYTITIEEGSDGTCLAWIHELPGCAARAPHRAEAERAAAAAVRAFLARFAEPVPERIEIAVAAEQASDLATAEDTEALIASDLAPLTSQDWRTARRRLDATRADLRAAIDGFSAADVSRPASNGGRTLRAELLHIGFIEFMYAAWTFDQDSPEGLAAFLDWTRGIAAARMDDLAARGEATATSADRAGAPRREDWTASKAARRLLWHELLHLPALQRAAAERTPPDPEARRDTPTGADGEAAPRADGD